MERFFGRGRELEAIAEARRSERLVTLLGPPGIGKTRLVRRYLEDLSEGDERPYFCDLTPARDLAAVVAREMGVRRVEDVAGAIADAGPIVLALDNLETIAKEAAPILAEWCARAPEAFFIVTSRVRLGVPGEHVIDVPPLDLATDAVALFVSLARVTPPTALMTALMRSLEGIPLAIELAAARSRVLGPERVLSRGRAVLSPLHTAIDASWEMLNETERSVLAQCSIFAGAFSIEAAEAVIEAPDVLEALTSLVDKSLLRSSGDGHFSLFVSIREHAAAQLEASRRPALAARHRTWILDSTRPRWEEFARTGASTARKALVAAKDELLAVGDDPLAILYLEPTLAVESGYDALMATLARGIALAEGELCTRLIMARGNASGIRGHLEESLADFEVARVEAQDPVIRAEALMFAGVRYRSLGRFDDARKIGDEALRVLTESGADAPRVEGACRAVTGLLLSELGESAAARASNLRARAIFDAAGDRWSEALPLANLAQLDQAAGEYEVSVREYEQALLRFREHGDRRYEARYLGYRAGLEHERGDLAAARAIYATALELLASMRIGPTEGYFRACLAVLEAAEGRMDDALREMDRAEMLLATGAPPAQVAAVEVHRGHLDLMLARSSDAVRAATLVARAQQRLRDVVLADRSEDVRFAVRLLTRALAGSAPAPSRAVLHVDADARSFRIGDQPPVDLTRRAALRHIVTALVDARGKPLTSEELLAIGWPGEKVVGDAGGNRVRVAVSTLRRLGLASVLLTSDAGYFLDARALT